MELSGAGAPDDLKALVEEYKEQRKAVCVSCLFVYLSIYLMHCSDPFARASCSEVFCLSSSTLFSYLFLNLFYSQNIRKTDVKFNINKNLQKYKVTFVLYIFGESEPLQFLEPVSFSIIINFYSGTSSRPMQEVHQLSLTNKCQQTS